MSRKPKCQAKNPSACIDPMCPEKRAQNTQLASAKTFAEFEQIKAEQNVKEKQILRSKLMNADAVDASEFFTPKHSEPISFISDYDEAIILGNSDTSAEKLDELATVGRDSVKYAVAFHPNVDETTLASLTKDKNASIVLRAAKNKRTPTAALEALSVRKNVPYNVLIAVAANPSMSSDGLDAMVVAHNLTAGSIAEAVLSNQNVSVNTLNRFMGSESTYVRGFIARHPKTSPAMLKILEKDADYTVRAVVRERNKHEIAALADKLGATTKTSSSFDALW